MRPVLSIAEMQAADAKAQAVVPLDVLVQRAGTAAGTVALAMLGGAYGRRVVVIAGKGNNGADGRVAGELLRRRGAWVTVVGPDGVGMPTGPVDLVLDAAFGTGFRGTWNAPPVPPGVPVLAVDIPSGVDGETGRQSGTSLPARRTITFAALKPGLLAGDGRRLAGEVTVADVGIPADGARILVIEDADVTALVPTRSPGDNKWSSAVMVVAGSPGMTGAAGLSARAAFRAGAGMVRLGVPGGDLTRTPAAEAVGVALPEVDWSDPVLEQLSRCAVLVVGPGIGRSDATGVEVRRLVAESPVPVLVDADGLFALGELSGPVEARSMVILTPHDGEYRRLMGEAPGDDRIDAARRLAARAGAVALVKGSTTVVAEPSGRVLVALAGSASLATAGTGDVLSGVIGAFVARGVAPLEAAAVGAHVHGRASSHGPLEGLMAGDLPELVSGVLSDLRRSGPAQVDAGG